MNLINKINYLRSNSVNKVKFPVSERAIFLTLKLIQGKDKGEQARQKIGNALVNELCKLAKINNVKLKVSDAKQYHKRRNGRIAVRQYGYYKPGGAYIYITNRTAARGQILASKSFTDTLLHEWTHHYDFYKLKIHSIHSKGFYSRLKHLKEKLGYFS